MKRIKIYTVLKMVGTCVYCGETRKENSNAEHFTSKYIHAHEIHSAIA